MKTWKSLLLVAGLVVVGGGVPSDAGAKEALAFRWTITMTTYVQTHVWVNFNVSTQFLPYCAWNNTDWKCVAVGDNGDGTSDKFDCSGTAIFKDAKLSLCFKDNQLACPGDDDWDWGHRPTGLMSGVQAVDPTECDLVDCSGSVGGVVDLPDFEPGAISGGADSSAPNAIALTGLAIGAVLLLAAGGWYIRRRAS